MYQQKKMRKLISYNMVTTDGYFEGVKEDISWHKVDEEVNDFIMEQLNSADTILFGRKTYEMMERFWPTEEAFRLDPMVAGMMSSYLKIVFSTTLKNADWEHTRLVKENAAEAVQKLKEKPGKDMYIFGSADLCKTLIKENLIDEFRLMINPVVLGKGKPFFHRKMNLQLLKTKVFGNGNVLLCYRTRS